MDGVKIVELVCLYHQFFIETGSDDLKKFNAWMSQNAIVASSEEPSISEKDKNSHILTLLYRLSKFTRLYNKNFFQEFNVKTIEEYYFLNSIRKLGSPAKSEVYLHNVVETTTGTKILKRLIDMKLVKELDDRLDKRIKRVKLTHKGETEIENLEASFSHMDEELLGYLSPESKEGMLNALFEINNYHTELYEHFPEEYGKGNKEQF